MASGLWDVKGVLSVDYLEKGHTLSLDFYADVLRQLQEKVKTIQGVLFHQDNTSAHSGGSCHQELT